MCAGHCDEADAIVSQCIDRMPLVGPLDQRRDQALAGQVSVVGDGDAPGVRSTRHRIDATMFVRRELSRSLDIGAARNPVNQTRAKRQRCTNRRPVEVEPSRALRLDAIGIDGDQLEINSITDSQHAVVRAHRDVLSAAPGPHSQHRLEVIFALLESLRGDDQMVQRRARNDRQRADGRSSAAKSSSILAPFGS